MPTEEQRAAAYRASVKARAVARAERCAALAGDPAQRAALEARWRPLLLARLQPDVLPDVDDDCGPCGRLLGN